MLNARTYSNGKKEKKEKRESIKRKGGKTRESSERVGIKRSENFSKSKMKTWNPRWREKQEEGEAKTFYHGANEERWH